MISHLPETFVRMMQAEKSQVLQHWHFQFEQRHLTSVQDRKYFFGKIELERVVIVLCAASSRQYTDELLVGSDVGTGGGLGFKITRVFCGRLI